MSTIRPRFVAGAVCALLLAGSGAPLHAQGRARRIAETARDILGAISDEHARSLPELDAERSFLDELADIDVDSLLPFDDLGDALDRVDPTGELGRLGTIRNRAVDPPDRARRSYNFAFRAERPAHQFVTYFTRGSGRRTMEAGLKRSGRYRAMAERIFREEGVPTDLIWLAQVESVWKPWALSSASAKGIWQFIPSTGQRYGLGRTYWVDERADPLESTRAAASYLRFLHRYFNGNWLLALAAYNSGEGRVKRAVAKAGRADFWVLYRRGLLPRETRNYVPAILATVMIAKDPGRYGISVTPDRPWRFDSVEIGGQLDLRVVADMCDTSLADIWAHNPHLRRGLTPPGRYALRIPEGARRRFAVEYARLPAQKRIRRGSPVDDAYGRS